nr:hypothetical protein [Tanacetum cinerariifolium]
MGGDGGVLNARSSGVIGERVIVMSIEDEDVPLVDVVLEGALGALGDLSCYCGDGVFQLSSIRLKMNEADDDMEVKSGYHFILEKWYGLVLMKPFSNNVCILWVTIAGSNVKGSQKAERKQ